MSAIAERIERAKAHAATARAYQDAAGTSKKEDAANEDTPPKPQPSGDPPRSSWWLHRGLDRWEVIVNPPQTQRQMLALYRGCSVTMTP
jgi:hypothetical protein